MSFRRTWPVAGWLVVGALAIAVPARAQIFGPNSDFPDANLVMPFDTTTDRTTFLSISNVTLSQARLLWRFYDVSGELLATAQRDLAGSGGTDVVDPTNFSDRSIGEGGQVENGPTRSVSGHRGFAVVLGNAETSIIGNFTLANLATHSAYGTNAMGFGSVGVLEPGLGLFGTTFNPSTLQDDQLMLIALRESDEDEDGDLEISSITGGAKPPAGDGLFDFDLTLYSASAPGGVLADGRFAAQGSAAFVQWDELFPGESLGSSATIVVVPSEGDSFSGGEWDDDADDVIVVIGFYGQAVGPYGAAQSLRSNELSTVATSATAAVGATAGGTKLGSATAGRPRFGRDPALAGRKPRLLGKGGA